MRMNMTNDQAALSTGRRPRRRPDHPEDYGRGPWWRLGELLFLGFIFPSPPPYTRMFDDDEDDETDA
ncbi:MAG TPA: hypothetical protein VLK84_25225 [Longimicrobium sp.]|nr:hypothetical protein [Longimicrobium sp.]